MSERSSRGTRHYFDGTGAYIALFLVVTAIAVAGYWSLIPHETAQKPVAEPEVEPTPSVLAPVVTQEPEPLPAEPPTPEPESEPAEPVQAAVTLPLPEEKPVDLTPVAPVLVVNPLVGDTVAAFSMDALQYSETMGDWRTHDGVDIAADAGTPVCAASSGTVLDVRDDDFMGTTVVITHDDGYDTLYANLQAEPTVVVGDYVTAGQVIGSVGKTALSESAQPTHLHFGVMKDGEFVDPAEYLKK